MAPPAAEPPAKQCGGKKHQREQHQPGLITPSRTNAMDSLGSIGEIVVLVHSQWAMCRKMSPCTTKRTFRLFRQAASGSIGGFQLGQ